MTTPFGVHLAGDEFYEQILHALNKHNILSVTDARGRILYANNNFCRISGYSQDELLGKTHNIVKSDVHSNDFYKDMWRTIASGHIWRGDVCNKRRDGKYFWVETSIIPNLNTEGKPEKYICIRSDITTLKESPEYLQPLTNKHRFITKSALILMGEEPDRLLTTLKTLFLQCVDVFSTGAITFWELTADRKLRKLLETGSSAEKLNSKSSHSASGNQTKLDWLAKNADSYSTFLKTSVNNHKGDPLKTKGFLSSTLVFSQKNQAKTFYLEIDADKNSREWQPADINLLKTFSILTSFSFHCISAEKKLETEKERLRLSQYYANIGTWDWNIQTGDLFWSERIAPLFGHEAGTLETSYENFINSVHPDDRKKVEDAIDDCVEKDIPYEIEHRVLLPDGTTRWLLERGGVTRDENGNPTRMLGVVQDIDRQKRIENELFLSRIHAEQANQAKSEFLSRMSHELRTPMNAVLGFAQLLSMDTSLTEDQQESAEEILNSGRHLLELINDILDLSKIEGRHLSVELQTVEVNSLISQCLALIKNQSHNQQITVDVEEYEGGLTIEADPKRMTQVLLNLITNAIKYNKPKGRVTIKAQSLEQCVRLSITDEGAGIPKEKLPLVFEPFNRLGAESGTIEGTGIGLTIAKQLVELMNGQIAVASQPGIGTTFYVDIPKSGD